MITEIIASLSTSVSLARRHFCVYTMLLEMVNYQILYQNKLLGQVSDILVPPKPYSKINMSIAKHI